jgi:hypothetical protein
MAFGSVLPFSLADVGMFADGEAGASRFSQHGGPSARKSSAIACGLLEPVSCFPAEPARP